MSEFTYIGKELELFAQAKNWKSYIKSFLKKYIHGNVLEVGAGLGSNTQLLKDSSYSQWLSLEPDYQLFQILENSLVSNDLTNCSAYYGTIDNLSQDKLFETILYLDVLEHIENDQEELIKSAQHLKDNGYLIILGPAHQELFTPFDEAIGHYRRYNKTSLKKVIPSEIEIIKVIYLDSVGLLASLGNKIILKQSTPSLKQIGLWDNFMVPLSKYLDFLLLYNIGKSILLIGQKKIITF